MSKQKTIEPSEEIIIKNQVYMNDVRHFSDEQFEETGKRPLFNIVTYGCQMNEHDSEKLNGMLSQMGYLETDEQDEADLIIFNTCCVRENAELKVYGKLGHLKSIKRKRPSLKIAVCGCMMQQEHIVKEIKTKYPQVDLVFGTHNIHNFPALLAESFDTDSTVVEVWDHEGDIIEGLPVIRKYGLKAFVNIMYGCNNFCTYCIVPYTRGRERSRDVETILNEVRELVSKGVKEITLLGQNVNSYGKTLDNPIDFSDLLKKVDAIEGVERIRFMTSHPKDLNEKLIATMAECPSVCEHMHLPLQAGSNELLKSMNRKYTRERYLELTKKIREQIPEVRISTDIIIGFPGETEDDVDQLIELIKEVGYDSAYTFIYSPRKGTPASEMTNQISDAVKHQRFERMLEAMNTIVAKRNMALKDTILEVLVEGPSKQDDAVMMGRTRGNRVVNFKGTKDDIGKLVQVRITDPKKFSLVGEKI